MTTRKTCFYVALAVVTVAASHSFAGEEEQEPFPDLRLSGSLRLRYEHQDNYNIKRYGIGQKDDFLLTRLRLNFDLMLREDFHAFAQLQDARLHYSDLSRHDFPKSCPYENRLDLRQAYIEHKKLWGGPFGLKLGRQAINYGDNRIWGPGDWGNAGRYTWDAAKLYYHTDFIHLDAIAAEQVLYDPIKFDGSHYPYKVFGLYGQLPRSKAASVDLFWVLKRDAHHNVSGESGADDLNRHTIGAGVKGEFGVTEFGNFDYAATAAGQLGNEGKDDVRAYALVTEIGYTFKRRFSPRIYAAYTHASGDSDPTDGRNETFDGVNGAVDKYYGRMNLFSLKNLIDYQCGFSIKPAQRMKLSADYHVFQLAERKDAWYYCNCKPQRRDNTGASGRNLGQEIDVIAKWQVPLGKSMKKAIKKLELMAGYAYFVPGSFIQRTGPAGDANWGFVQVAAWF
ncbi:MAG: alginate export family protein [Planctomycetes bacterium]|nr:alginate export family protein [Planctomycetota bacterium]